jgi:hypothetical protein
LHKIAIFRAEPAQMSLEIRHSILQFTHRNHQIIIELLSNIMTPSKCYWGELRKTDPITIPWALQLTLESVGPNLDSIIFLAPNGAFK